MSDSQVVQASAVVDAPADVVFDLIADPTRQPEWDGNDNLKASTAPRVTSVGDVFVMTNTSGRQRSNEIVELTEGRLIAWLPGPVGEPRPGHLWRWEIAPIDPRSCRVTHTYDWTRLTEPRRVEIARATTTDHLQASVDRLKALAESGSAT